jgi:chitinase
MRRTLAATLAGLVAIPIALASGGAAYGGPHVAASPIQSVFHQPAVRQVGYFIQWGIYGRSFFVKNLDTSGTAARLTHLDYAFGNVAPEASGAVTCQSGDVWADYERPVPAEESVDGVADQWGEPLNGNFGQLLKLKAKYPNLKVMLSLGGWSWSKYFSDAALTPQSRAALVSSCVDRFINGNLPALGPGDAGGPGSAANLFDGIDLDWEWPGSDGNVGNVIRPEDRANLTLLLKEFRTQLDAAGRSAGKRYELSAFLPAAPSKIAAGFDGKQIFKYLDFGNIQGYDYHGTWETTTNQQSAIRVPFGAPPVLPVTTPPTADFSIEATVKAWLGAGARRDQLVVGIPYYGQGWTGVSGGGDGLFQPATGAAPGTWAAGNEDYKVLKNLPSQGFTVHRDIRAGFAWLFDGTTFWTYDDPATVLQKSLYIRLQGLGGAMVWELSGDDANGTLTKTIHIGLTAGR